MNKYIGLAISYAICFHAFILYGIYLVVTKNRDFLNVKLWDTKFFNIAFNENCCSGWVVSHFLFNFILGVLFPNCQLAIILVGILWEVVEWSGGWLGNKFFKDKVDKLISKDSKCKGDYCTRWMTGSFKDIVFNIFGLYTGVLLRLIIDFVIKRSKRNN